MGKRRCPLVEHMGGDNSAPGEPSKFLHCIVCDVLSGGLRTLLSLFKDLPRQWQVLEVKRGDKLGSWLLLVLSIVTPTMVPVEEKISRF